MTGRDEIKKRYVLHPEWSLGMYISFPRLVRLYKLDLRACLDATSPADNMIHKIDPGKDGYMHLHPRRHDDYAEHFKQMTEEAKERAKGSSSK